MEIINRQQLYDIKEQGKKAIVIFTTKWCGECKMGTLLLSDIENELSDYFIYEIDADEQELWVDDNDDEYKIMTVPRYEIIEKGTVRAIKEGYLSKEDLFEFINNEI